MITERGLQGFSCARTGERHGFEVCEACADPCHPLPLLMAMSKQREIVDGVYSVTELSRPAQAVYLSRHFPYWVEPESQIFMLTGSAIHSVLETGHKHITNKAEHIVEAYSEIEFDLPNGHVKLRGTPDYYDVRGKTLWDYKNIKAYPAKKLKAATNLAWNAEDYFAQLNIYRAVFFPEAEHLKLECIIMGWTNQDGIRDGLRPIEQINVPMGSVADVTTWVKNRLDLFLLNEKDQTTIPLCAKADRWEDKSGKPLRCMKYCNASADCKQHKAWKDGVK